MSSWLLASAENLSELIDANGSRILDSQSAYGRNRRLTVDARGDLRKLVLQSIFNKGADSLATKYDGLPFAAQNVLIQALSGDMRLAAGRCGAF